MRIIFKVTLYILSMIAFLMAAGRNWRHCLADQTGGIIDTKHTITETSPGWVLGTDVAVGTGDGVTEYKYGTYTVPDGVHLVFVPRDELQCYLYDVEAAPAEMGSYVPVIIKHKDTAGYGTIERLRALYVNCKFAADVNDRKKILNTWEAKSKELIEIWVIPANGNSMDVSAQHFALTCQLVAKQLTQ